jgi:hypothetical protein
MACFGKENFKERFIRKTRTLDGKPIILAPTRKWGKRLARIGMSKMLSIL